MSNRSGGADPRGRMGMVPQSQTRGWKTELGFLEGNWDARGWVAGLTPGIDAPWGHTEVAPEQRSVSADAGNASAQKGSPGEAGLPAAPPP